MNWFLYYKQIPRLIIQTEKQKQKEIQKGSKTYIYIHNKPQLSPPFHYLLQSKHLNSK
ncbi:hypothetical protein Hanom_Chr03g00243361 [Helianthus anomalus]